MRRFTNWLLFLLALALAALGAAAQLGLVHAPFPPLAFGAAAAVFAALLVIRALPLKARRPVVFLVALALLVALTGGLAYFQFVIKPMMVKGFISAAFAPKPTAVTAEAARIEQWPPRTDGDRHVARLSGRSSSRRRSAGVVTAIHFEFGRRRRSRRAADQHRQFGRAGRPRQRPRAAQERRRDARRAKGRSSPGQHAPIDRRHGARDARFGRRDRRAHARRDRAEGDQGALRRPARPAQRRSRAICRGRREPRHAAAARSDLRRLSRARGARWPRSPSARTVTMTVDAIPAAASRERSRRSTRGSAPNSRNVTVRAEFANPDRKLLPGMFANLTVTTGATGRRADAAAHRDRLQPLRRQRLRGQPRRRMRASRAA